MYLSICLFIYLFIYLFIIFINTLEKPILFLSHKTVTVTDLVVPVPVQPIFFKADPVDTGRKLNGHKTSRTSSKRLM